MSAVIDRFHAIPEDEYQEIVEYICGASWPILYQDGEVGVAHEWSDSVRSTKLSEVVASFLELPNTRHELEVVLAEIGVCTKMIREHIEARKE